MKTIIFIIFLFSFISCYIRPLRDEWETPKRFWWEICNKPGCIPNPTPPHIIPGYFHSCLPFNIKLSFDIGDVEYVPYKYEDIHHAFVYPTFLSMLKLHLLMLWTVVTVMIPSFFLFPFYI